MSYLESDQILEDLCFSNGLNYNEFKSSQFKFNENIKYLEMFFNGFPYILHMDKFPNLTELKIIAQELTTISGLETCLNLSELWIAECKLNKISGLKNCRNLKKLYLYSNKLTKIENLEQINLEIFWISDNKISVIEGIDHMSDLVELNLAKNCILKIGNSLKNIKNLENLNLSSNLIDNFQEITYLQHLPNLKYLCFKDPQYGHNPVTYLCNYSLYIIYHLPGLINLDTLSISQKIVKELADSTINKKKLWYFMKLSTINREYHEMVTKLDSIKLKHSTEYFDKFSQLTCQIKDIEKKIKILTNDQNQNESQIKENENSIKAIEEKFKDVELNIQFVDGQYKKSLDIVNQEIEFRKKLIFIELENGGNIRFEFGTNKNDGWYKSCYDLFMSRFCSQDYVSKSINGIKIKKIIRITNRVLIAKYEEKLLAEVDEYDYLNNKPSVRKKIDFLMYCWRSKLGTHIEELYNIIKNGFNDPSVYKKNGYEEAIPFSNNLYTSDLNRIESSKGSQSSRFNIPFKYGYALMCKVYTNKFVDYSNQIISQQNYPDNFGIKKKHTEIKLSNISEEQKKCDCKSKQTEWFLFNKNLAVPEYIIEFEYFNKFNTDSLFEKELGILDLKKNEVIFKTNSDTDSDNENAYSEVDIEELILNEIKTQYSKLEDLNLNNLVELNLHNIGLTSLNIESFKNFKNVKKLILTFNKLTSIKEINNLPTLEYLDVSFNQIKSLNGIKLITKIHHLDLSNNQFSEIIPLCFILKQNFPILIYLDLNNNPIKRANKLRSLLFYSLRSLQIYNKQKINDYERDFLDNKTKLNKEFIKYNSATITTKPRCLRYSFVTDLFTEDPDKNFFEFDSNLYDELNSESDTDLAVSVPNNIFDKVTVLNVDNQGLFKLTNFEYLINLKYASFNNNYITKIEGLDKCNKLEELSLENNLIQSLNGLENLENLRKINLDNNEIVFYDDMQNKFEYYSRNWDINLTRLTYLSMSNNKLSSIKFVLKLPSLIEFYASLNQIKNLRDIFHLKQLNSLSILDMSSNPMCADSKYRIFLIYHLKILKSLDGLTIEPSELTEARDSFGGKLTCDFIAEKFTHTKLSDIRSLEFPQCSIRNVDLGPTPQIVSEQFESLRSLNLENNNLTSFSGLIYLKNLKILCLNNNKIESIFPKQKQNSNSQNNLNNNDVILPNLEVLHLAFNGITDLVQFQISRLSTLKALFLQGNEITKIEGIDTLRDLRELVLDKNKIKAIGEFSFIGQSHRLLELHIEENRLRDLNNIQMLKHLQKLFVANNKINDYSDIEKLMDLNYLYEISLINNPISRRPHYRITMVFRMKRMRILDMIEVNEDDRIRAEIYFCEQQQNQQVYYNSLVQTTPQVIANQLQNQSSLNQLEHQFMSLSQSPRLKPITLLDKQMITNPQISSGNTANGSNSNNTNSSKKIKNLDKLNKDLQTRYRN